MIEGDAPMSQIHEWLQRQIEDAFQRGQQSGKNIANRIHRYNNKRKDLRQKEYEDVYDDAVQRVFTEMADEMPCNKTMRHLAKCPLRHTASYVFTKYRDTFIERLQQVQQTLLNERHPEGD
jgi:hypothetical protein